MSQRAIQKSRFLSLILRHEPQSIGIDLDPQGWVEVSVLLRAMAQHGKPLSENELRELVSTNDKQRFLLSSDGRRIRANQGHSLPVELELPTAIPPTALYHGTVERFLEAIWAKGLLAMERRHVHLTTDRNTAFKVGSRRGKAVILQIEAQRMHQAGHEFYLSENGVWLIDAVPSEYLKLFALTSDP